MADDPDSRPAARRRLERRPVRGAGARLAVEVVGVRSPTDRAAVAGLGRWLARVLPAEATGLVTVALVGDARMRAINRRFRRQDRVTDVLSFGVDARALPRGEPRALGDVVIARGRARRQAEALGHSLRAEVRTLALHGVLHLLGYDHERDRGEMAALERRLRRRGGLGQGVIERGARPAAGSAREGKR